MAMLEFDDHCEENRKAFLAYLAVGRSKCRERGFTLPCTTKRSLTIAGLLWKARQLAVSFTRPKRGNDGTG